MRALIFILILLSFFQGTFLPLNLVFLIIVLRSYIRIDRSNLYLAFFMGLFLSLLLQEDLGIRSFTLLISVAIAHLTTKAPFSKHLLTVVPFSALLLFLNYLIISAFSGRFFIPTTNLIIEVLLALPIYIVLRVWEDRFIVHRDIKLKL